MGADLTADGSRAAPTAEWWLDLFRSSMPAMEHMLVGSVVVDALTGRLVACNPRAVELLGGNVAESVTDMVEAGVISKATHRVLARQERTTPESWRRDITLHLPGGPVERTVVAATIEEPRLGARVVVAMLCERGRDRERIQVTNPPLDFAPSQLHFVYDEHLRIRGIDPRLADYWQDPTRELGAIIWLGIHPADIHLAAPWAERLVTGEVASVEYTVRVRTHLGNWMPVHYELRRLLGDADAPILATLTVAGDFKKTIAPGQLSPREFAVVRALFDGRRLPQIAERDDVSVKTLRNQLSSVYRKLVVADQGDLLATYHRPHSVASP